MDYLRQRSFLSVLLTLFLFNCFLIVSPAVANENDAWHFHIAPYAWLAGLDGSVSTMPGLPPADVDVDFYDDILGNINGAFMLVGEVQKGRFGLATDVVYTDIETDSPTPGQYFTALTSQTTNWIISAAGFYRLLANDRFFIDGIFDVRYWSVDSELTLRGGPAGSYAIANSKDWFDPIVEFKG